MQDLSEFASGEEYDAQYGDSYEDEIAALTSLAEARRQPVLDLCCGTGLVTIPLAMNAGLEVHGVDASEPMLRRARAKGSALGVADISFHLANAVDLRLHRPFGLALMTGNAFQAFLNEQEILGLLQNVHRQLLPGGIFVFDTRLQEGYDLDLDDDYQLWGEYRFDGRAVRYLGKQVDFDREHGVLLIEMKRQYQEGREVHSASELKFTPMDRLLQLVNEGGFEVEQRYSNWRFEPLDESAEGMVLLLSKR